MDYLPMNFGYSYMFPAMRGVQAGMEYYVAMCPLHLLPKLFLFNENELPPELRAQRSLNNARIPEIKKYIIDNIKDYAFSAITVSIDGNVEFQPVAVDGQLSDVGKLIIPMSARFVINDGQHRRAAIEAALNEKPELCDETIAVVFYHDAGLRRCQQLFADLNKHAIRPTKSIGVLYDYRDPLACLSRKLIDTIPCFKDFIETEKTTISNRSIKLFTLSGIYQATGELLKKHKNDLINSQEQQIAIDFWLELYNLIPEWKLAAKRQVTSSELRRDYIHVHNVVLEALGQTGYDLLVQYPSNWKRRIQNLKELDWSRSNPIWEGRALQNGHMSKSNQSIRLTANLFRTHLNLIFSAEDQKLEQAYHRR
jgi:DNA sulfur modification protein DndB